MLMARLTGEFQSRLIMLKHKKILLGVTGGIAAYKTPELVRLLKKQGAEVRVICTPAALQFVTLKTLSVVSENPALVDFFNEETGEWNHHVNLGIWADALVIAPCGSNTLAKMVSGQCDNLLLTTYLSARCPVWIAPAMDLDMYEQASVKEHFGTLQSRGVHIIDSEIGPLASGLEGKGRMAEPEHILEHLQQYFKLPDTIWKNKHVLITAGPTFESIDPVRFIGNRSTGKMGIEIANVLQELGAEVQLVLGPSHEPIPEHITLHRVETAQEMLEACSKIFPQCDVAIFAAAVADYRVAEPASQKIKKSEDSITLHLIKNPDILATLSSKKAPHQKVVGFALETQNAEQYGFEKLQKKNLDAIVINSVSDQTGFGVDTNQVTVLHKNDKKFTTTLLSKTDIAKAIADKLHEWDFFNI